MKKEYLVEKETTLKEFIEETWKDLSKHKRKSLLVNGVFQVNQKVQTKYNYPLKKGDMVSMKEKEIETNLDIIYEDKDIIVIDKPSGFLTISTDNRDEPTLYKEVSEYVKKQKLQNRIFIVHRLDKDTSGVILFCKDQKLKRMFQDHWNELVLKREYIGIVEGSPKQKKGCVRQYLKENDAHQVYVTKNKNDGKLAITDYEVIDEMRGYSLIRFELETGRKNQIRVACQSLGCPIVGDKKYGAETNPLKRLGLHASKLVCVHPVTKETFEWKSQKNLSFPKKMLK